MRLRFERYLCRVCLWKTGLVDLVDLDGNKILEHLDLIFVLCFFFFFLIKTLFTLGLEHKIYRNEMITGKDKKVT